MDWNTSLTANVSGMEGRAALAGFVHPHANKLHARASQQVRPDSGHEVSGDVLGSRIERHRDDAGIDGLEPIEDRVLLPDQHAVVPVVLQPLTQERLDDAEVDHAPEWVKAVRLAGEVDDVSVPMEIAALAFVTADAVAAVDRVCAGDLVGHDAGELPSNWRNLCRKDAARTSCQRATAGDGTIIAVQVAVLGIRRRLAP